MYVSARTDYAVRAMLAVTAERPRLVKAAGLAAAQDIPLSFLQGILLDLRRAGLLHSHRGVEGGYALARPAEEITVGDVVRAVGGALTTIRDCPRPRRPTTVRRRRCTTCGSPSRRPSRAWSTTEPWPNSPPPQ